MKNEDFLKEIELIKKDVADFKLPYSSCQYFHERSKHFSKEQFDKALETFYQMMEKKTGGK